MSGYVAGRPDVLQRDRRRPEGRGPRLLDGRLHAGDRGRRQDVQERGREVEARGQPRAVDRPRRHRPPGRTATTAASTRACDRGATWEFKANLPDHAVLPRGGRQRDAVLQRLRRHAGQHARSAARRARPRRTASRTTDWFVTTGGDGFVSRASIPRTRTSSTPSRSTAGSCASTGGRASRSTSSRRPGQDEAPLRWNWDSPLIISPHSHTRLYFAAQRLFRSDDRGDTLDARQRRPHRGRSTATRSR